MQQHRRSRLQELQWLSGGPWPPREAHLEPSGLTRCSCSSSDPSSRRCALMLRTRPRSPQLPAPLHKQPPGRFLSPPVDRMCSLTKDCLQSPSIPLYAQSAALHTKVQKSDCPFFSASVPASVPPAYRQYLSHAQAAAHQVLNTSAWSRHFDKAGKQHGKGSRQAGTNP